MHLLARETRMLDEAGGAEDLGQTPADLVFLSFSDSDLASVADAWQAMAERPGLRLANLGRLRHPMSIDLYAEQVVARARCVVVRLLGGLDYWRYGAEEFLAMCRAEKIPLIVVPGDGREDARLAEMSTAPRAAWQRVDALLRHGGPENTARALTLAAHLAGLGPDDGLEAAPVPGCGEHRLAGVPRDERPLAVIVFYRSHLLASDIAPIHELAAALAERGLAVRAVYVSSLKDPEVAGAVAGWLAEWRPAVVLNATAFSARGDSASPLDAAGVPVLQLVLSGSARDAWSASTRGLSPTDLAMHVVLPELDGRLLTTAISFKAEQDSVPGLEFARMAHRPDADGIALAADRAAGWARLAATARAARRVAIVLSDYPGVAGQIAHAVGLDSLASLDAILVTLRDADYEVASARCATGWTSENFLSLAAYRQLSKTLPDTLRNRIIGAWGDARNDPACIEDNFVLRYAWHGNIVVAIQPDRGAALDRKANYHDPELPPRHSYVAFYLWLHAIGIHALVHLGTHGTLEWLPGKAVALSADCAPVALLRGLPVIYPFIVNNPGEAAAAKRRLGAVTIGHLTPPLQSAGSHGGAAELERLIDEYASADGMGSRRTSLLRREILEHADSLGLLAESGVARDAPEADALARLDAYLCDVKDLQIRDGLHVFGCAPPPDRRAALLAALSRACPGVAEDRLRADLDASPDRERAALLAALDGHFVAPGPAGAPTRGRADVLPTGRNLTTIDPRAVPTRAAMVLAARAAAEILRRHLQDHGDWPRRLVLDLWGSTSLRTGGEDFALALTLIGARPVWDDGSNRVTGIEILPVALLERPRVDVTLRVSGVFRDAFEAQISLFDAATSAIAARDEAPDWNGLAASCRGLTGAALRRATTRVFGAAPGDYGAGVAALIDRGAWTESRELADAYLAGSGYAFGAALDGMADRDGFAARVASADAFVHSQDHRETDLLDSTEYAAHEGGFAAAARMLGATPALYHADTADPERPRARTVAEEIVRIVRGRAANPAWIAGMMRHGYRGASEIARALNGLHGFAATLPERFDGQFDLLFDATLGDADVDRFLRDANPEARAAMAARFDEARRRDLWRPRRNAVGAMLERAS